MLPDDVILNTRRAFSTSNATVNGYSTSLGAPEGRYLAPANSADCIQVKAGDCAPRSLLRAVAVVQARRFRRGQESRGRRREERRSAFRSPQRVRHAELHDRLESGFRRDDLPHDLRLHGCRATPTTRVVVSAS